MLELTAKVCLLTLISLAFSMNVFAQDNSCKAFSFNLAPSYQIGPDAYPFIAEDLNGDGKIDLVATNYNTATVSVLYGDDADGFFPPRLFATEINANALAAGDLNRDGKVDLVVASTSKIAVLLNNGQGGFLAPIITSFASNVYGFYSLKVGDFNGDGNGDVAGVNRTHFNVFLGDGQGKFSLVTNLEWIGNWGNNGSEIVVGNFNNDNLADLAVTGGDYPTNWQIGIMLGNSTGNFIFNNRHILTGFPTGIEIGDLNNDNLTDLAVSAYYPYQNSTPQTYFIEPWLGNGNGGFSAGTKVQFPFVNRDVFKGDFNGDGKMDLATGLGDMIAVAAGNNDGTFQNESYWAVPGSQSIISADVNRDAKTDILVFSGAYPNSLVSVLINSGTGFTVPKPVFRGTNELEAADFNNDGANDLVSAFDSDFPYTSEVIIALNDKNGGLLPDRKFETPKSLKEMKTGDFNGDGKQDVITAHWDNARVLAVYLGDGTGNLGQYITTSLNVAFEDIIVGDFNSDNKDDVFAVDRNGRGYSLLSNGNGTFTTAPTSPVEFQEIFKLEKGDFNGDNKLDLIIYRFSEMKLWLGDGAGRFAPTSNAIPLSGIPVAGDYNGDGKLDLAALAFGGVQAVIGDGNGGFGSLFSLEIAGGGNGKSLISGDFNLDGLDDLAFAVTLNYHKNLVIVSASGEETPAWKTPIFYSLGGLDDYSASLVASDFNSDSKVDIGYNAGLSRGIIFNTAGQKPCASINDVTVTEGDEAAVTANFTVSLSAPSEQDVYISYTLEGQTATAGTDFQNTSGRLKIPAGQTTGNIPVTVNGDLIDEFNETFIVHLASPNGAALQKADATGTITDNDAEPTLTISDVTASEGFSWHSFNFKVTLSAPSGKPVSYRYSTADGTAVGNKDYSSANGIRNIPVGTTSDTVSISVIGESTYETDENFYLNLSEAVNVAVTDHQAVGTIVNDDQIPFVFANFNTISEGDTGISNGTVHLQLSNPTYLPVSLNLLTSDGAAIGGKDYQATDKIVTIPAEQISATTEIQVLGDTINEPPEHFFLNIYNTVNATVNNPQSQLIIIDDEFVANDFDRDGRTDVAVYRPGDKNWYILNSSNNRLAALNFGISSDLPVSGDYNGDGRTDIAVWRAENGTWYTPVPNRTQQWGANGDVPAHGDYDNDGKIDLALFRPTTQTWYIQLSSDGSHRFVQFGLSTDTPVPADYDGDGKTDIAVYRPESGSWYILRSGDGGFTAVQFGISTDKPVPADYDGDGKADITVFRDGVWHQLRSSVGDSISFQWGTAGDKPVPGNYDGDDKTDFAVYRGGVWYIWQSSTNSFLAKQFGLPDDIPIPFVSNN